MEKHKVTIIPGDGIGPEISESVQQIFAAAGVPIEWEEQHAGLAAYEKFGMALPEETLESIKRNKIALKGPTTTPVGTGHKSVNVTIRKALDLFANVRPARTLPGVETRFHNVDILIVRENIEDSYAGIEYFQTPDVAECLKVITRPGSMAVMEYSFALAKSLGRKKVTCVHKANIHKLTDGLFLQCFREVAARYPEIETHDIIVDNLCMQLVTRPEQFDVLVLPNLYGDIVSDLCAGMVGGLGVAPGGNIGSDFAVFEAVHGSAPDIAGLGKANPTALLLSGLQMLRYMGLYSYADRIEQALRTSFEAGIKTGDLGGKAGTEEFTQGVIGNIPAPLENIEQSGEAPKKFTFRAPAPREADWRFDGIDFYFRHEGIPKHLPTEHGKFRLDLITNRGTKVYPGPERDILMVNWFRCRYLAEDGVSNDEIFELITFLTGLGIDWMHIEKIYSENEQMMYTKA